MNRIVRENYRVADLPEDLRLEFENVDRVRVIIEPVLVGDSGSGPTPLRELFARAKPGYRNFDEVVSHIEALRAEWD